AAPRARAPKKPASAPAPGAEPALDGRVRAVVDAVLPSIDAGRFAAKALVGVPFEVTAHVFADGHDVVRAMLCWWNDNGGDTDGAATEAPLQAVEMTALGNDVWHAALVPAAPGRLRYRVLAWVDHFRSWRTELQRRVDADDIRLAALAGAALADQAAVRALAGPSPADADAGALRAWAEALHRRAAPAGGADIDIDAVKALALDGRIAAAADRHPDRHLQARSEPLPLVVDRARAGFSAWYELFPRSAGDTPGRHGTFRDVIARLPYIAAMGFDVLYLPPIHPIGRAKRKGRNNALAAEADDVGSPWAIGASEGGHTEILPALGTADDLRALVAAAREHGLELALDIAFQCAPDHPWVAQHPAWFRRRPDGSVQYAENPPKKYQDIYPFDFETDDWRALWAALKGVFDHWIGQGVAIFRVDNPHTKAFPFWAWCIDAIKREHAGVLFLAEAFTRPKVMHRLAKLGFSQSYTYFTWRRSKQELTEYFTELYATPGRDYFRPNVWPNTPDILNDQLHAAPRPVFMTRLLLAATLSPNYGIYGPAFELMERTPRNPGSEEYLDSEKYQLRHWSLDAPDTLAGFIAQVNQARHAHAALQGGAELRFFPTDNDALLAYGRRSADGASAVIGVVNLDPRLTQSGWVDVDAAWLGLGDAPTFEVDDLLSGRTFTWRGGGNFVILDPADMPAHLLHARAGAPGMRP
ncbi:MAG TPA: alpha-1,4-glucan--maltose-1-phosphate maltosyltransferase, partial [Burkholderiaceae bacterium]|nr:alpha-1,4-glucan--maltose-1-phosphate maltosyltransferase [Burkholderiaceae bacterium]